MTTRPLPKNADKLIEKTERFSLDIGWASELDACKKLFNSIDTTAENDLFINGLIAVRLVTVMESFTRLKIKEIIKHKPTRLENILSSQGQSITLNRGYIVKLYNRKLGLDEIIGHLPTLSDWSHYRNIFDNLIENYENKILGKEKNFTTKTISNWELTCSNLDQLIKTRNILVHETPIKPDNLLYSLDKVIKSVEEWISVTNECIEYYLDKKGDPRNAEQMTIVLDELAAAMKEVSTISQQILKNCNPQDITLDHVGKKWADYIETEIIFILQNARTDDNSLCSNKHLKNLTKDHVERLKYAFENYFKKNKQPI